MESCWCEKLLPLKRSYWERGKFSLRVSDLKPFIRHLKAPILQQGCFFFYYSLAPSFTNWVKSFTDLLLFAYVGIHQVKILVFDNYYRCPMPLKVTVIQDSSSLFHIMLWSYYLFFFSCDVGLFIGLSSNFNKNSFNLTHMAYSVSFENECSVK